MKRVKEALEALRARCRTMHERRRHDAPQDPEGRCACDGCTLLTYVDDLEIELKVKTVLTGEGW